MKTCISVIFLVCFTLLISCAASQSRDALREEMSVLKSQISNLEKGASNLDTRQSFLETSVKSLEIKVSNVEENLDDLSGNITSLRDEITPPKEGELADLSFEDNRNIILSELEGTSSGDMVNSLEPDETAPIKMENLPAEVPGSDGNDSTVPEEDKVVDGNGDKIIGDGDKEEIKKEEKSSINAEEFEKLTPAEYYKKGYDHVITGDYDSAVAVFRGFLSKYPEHELTDNVYYWTGECYYAKKEFSAALIEFQKAVEIKGNKQPDAMLKVAYSKAALGDKDAALATLNELVQKFPGTWVARLAEDKLKKIK